MCKRTMNKSLSLFLVIIITVLCLPFASAAAERGVQRIGSSDISDPKTLSEHTFAAVDLNRTMELPFDEDGMLTYTFEKETYLFLRDTVTGAEYCADYFSRTENPCLMTTTHKYKSQMYIPAGTVTLTLTDNGDDTYLLRYALSDSSAEPQTEAPSEAPSVPQASPVTQDADGNLTVGRDWVVTEADGTVRSIVPAAPQKLTVLMFFTPNNRYANTFLADLSNHPLKDMEEYGLIACCYSQAEQGVDAVRYWAEHDSEDITYAVGRNFDVSDMTTEAGLNYAYSTFVCIDANGAVRAFRLANLSVDELIALLRQTLGDDFADPGQNIYYFTAYVRGAYCTNIQEALDRINEIRYEACEEGVTNPADGQPLTLDDYVPVVWSAELEKIARQRAAEALIHRAHERPDKSECFSIDSKIVPNMYEDLAWNSQRSMVTGIDQFYTEKSAWVNRTPGKVTGHYTSMIDPRSRSVGLGHLYAPGFGTYNSCLAMRLSKTYQGIDTTFGEPTDVILSSFRMHSSYITDVEISQTPGIEGFMQPGERMTPELFARTQTAESSGRVLLRDGVTWSSSDPSVLTVENGVAVAKGEGTTILTGSLYGKYTATLEIRVLRYAFTVIDKNHTLELPFDEDGTLTYYFEKATDLYLHNTVTGTDYYTDYFSRMDNPNLMTETPVYRWQMHIPAGEVRLTLTDNGDDTYTLGYELLNVPTEPNTAAPTDTPTESEPVILGDTDCDGKVTIMDATAIQRRLASLPTPSFNETAADADKDNRVTILDATAIQRHLASLPIQAQGIGKPIA